MERPQDFLTPLWESAQGPPGPGQVAAKQCWQKYRAGEMTFEQMRKILWPYTNDATRDFFLGYLREAEKLSVQAMNAKDAELIEKSQKEVSKWTSKISAWEYWDQQQRSHLAQ